MEQLFAIICLATNFGLSGEIRPVNGIDQGIIEAEKLGFEELYISKYNKKGLDPKTPALK